MRRTTPTLARRAVAVCVLMIAMVVALLAPVGSASATNTLAAVGPGDDLPSAGCGSSRVGAGDVTVSTTSGGVARTYIRHVPPGHDGSTPMPLVVDIHGWLQGAALQQVNSEWSARADATGFVVVYPQGIANTWNPSIDGPDVAFIGDLLDEVEQQLCLDTNRIYVTGFSLGALMTSVVACVYADRVAAVAPIAWARYPVAEPACERARPVPFLTIHGSADGWVPYGPIPANVAAWAARNGCAAAPAAEPQPDDDVVTITRFRYACGDAGDVYFYDITGGGHSWPGSQFSRQIAAAVGYTTFAFHASDVIWDFFAPQRAQDDIVTYTARFTPRQMAALERLAAATGTTVEDIVRAGVRIFRSLAEDGGASPGPQRPNDGSEWLTLRWPAPEETAIDATATAWGADGDELHEAGGRLVLAVIAALGSGA